MKVHSTHGTSYLSPFGFFFLLFDLLLFPTSKLNHNCDFIKLNKKLQRPNANKCYFLHVVILDSNAYGGKCQMQIRAYAHTSVQHTLKTNTNNCFLHQNIQLPSTACYLSIYDL
jgi:hypothetical protein